MDNHLAPTYQYLFGEHWVLWFNTSNSYTVIDKNFKLHLEYYLKATTVSEFGKFIDPQKNNDAKAIADALSQYLNDCNLLPEYNNPDSTTRIEGKRKLLSTYQFNAHTFRIHYDSEAVKKVIHPAIAHLKIESNTQVDTIFDVYLSNDDLFLFKDGILLTREPKRDYHKIQGKFMLHLFCCVHHNDENEWIGTLHGSTISDGTSSILFVGESGKGKSTLCALLAAQGFSLVADDISPLAEDPVTIYTNPAAISIKNGAFDILRPLVNNFETIETQQLNKSKGVIKFLPFSKPAKNHYPCHTIILVNYKKDSKTELQKISVAQLLEIVIPDSWLSPSPHHARQFLEWLQKVNMYQLTYSNTERVTRVVSDIFSKKHSVE